MPLTPMMNQYLQVKEKCKDCILFFRLGDFYEMFFEDAKCASKELELVLTGRDCGLKERAPMCGIPYHAADIYIKKLLNKGYKVAICEQLEDPALAKGIVERDIIKIITPGTYTNSSFLEDKKNNYVMSIYYDKEIEYAGICFADISTGDFFCTDVEYNFETILNEISKYVPSEIIIQKDIEDKFLKTVSQKYDVYFTKKDDEYFSLQINDTIEKYFGHTSIDSFKECTKRSVNGILQYIFETQRISLTNIDNIQYYNSRDYMGIDINSRRNLELTQNNIDRSKKGSLLWILDKTRTSMGSRTLRKWIEQPLLNKEEIEKRLDAVEELKNNFDILKNIQEELNKIYDIERISGKISNKSVNAKELLSLKYSLKELPTIKKYLQNLKCDYFIELYNNLDELNDIYNILEASINENPPVSTKEGDLIKEGYNSQIDELKLYKLHGKEWIANLEKSEKEATGIKSLKISYNKVFGYYIEITKANIGSIPEGRYIRKQTLASSERYITPELKDMEDKILRSEEKLKSLEYNIFVQIRDSVEIVIDRLKKSAKILSIIDCLGSFSFVALDNNYCKPSISNDGEINIKNGRHPVVEKMLPSGGFICNDSLMDNKDNQMLILTGPNMAGKSTYMRQIALIIIMAHIGSFVPASSAKISICDKVFTRIGASDDLAGGKSTFMLEMWEVSNILKNATSQSLIIMDEVGRGTSTFDGLSIAWSVIEYICKKDFLRCKTLFATHYHELIKLQKEIKGVKNYSIEVKKIGDEIAFLRKIVPKGADESYGIEVAMLAGLPKEVTDRARDILTNIEKGKVNKSQVEFKEQKHQINILDLEKEKILLELKNIDLMNLTPLESMNKLYSIISRVKNL